MTSAVNPEEHKAQYQKGSIFYLPIVQYLFNISSQKLSIKESCFKYLQNIIYHIYNFLILDNAFNRTVNKIDEKVKIMCSNRFENCDRLIDILLYTNLSRSNWTKIQTINN